MKVIAKGLLEVRNLEVHFCLSLFTTPDANMKFNTVQRFDFRLQQLSEAFDTLKSEIDTIKGVSNPRETRILPEDSPHEIISLPRGKRMLSSGHAIMKRRTVTYVPICDLDLLRNQR